MRSITIYTLISRSLLALICLALLLVTCIECATAQTSGISESSVILNINNGGNTYYDLQAATPSPDFDGANLGTFTSSQSLALAGAQNKTFKCSGCNIAGTTLFYRVYQVYAIPPAFSQLNIPFFTNDAGGCGGNQTYITAANTTNLINGLSSGTYALEVYSTASYTGCGTGINLANNNGLNYKATFSVNGMVIQYSGITVLPTVTALGTVNASLINTNGTITNLCTAPINIMRVSAGAFNQTSPVNYIQFSVKPLPGYQFTVSAIKINIRKATGGPNNGRIDYSANNGAFVQGSNYLTVTTPISCTSAVPLQSITPAGLVITDTTNGLIVRAYFWASGTATGALDFSNLSVEGIVSEINGPPKLSLPSASLFTATAATLGATLVSNSGSPVTARGTVYKLTSGVTATDNNLDEGSANIGIFSHTRSGLNPQTQYYYAGYATNSFGTGLTAESNFRTRSKAPVTQASAMTASTVSASAINLSWSGATFPATGANQCGYLIIYSTGTPSIIVAPGSLPPASVVANGTILATVPANLPSLPLTSAIASGLAGNTTYNFLIIPYTWNGINTNTYSYLITGAPTASATTIPSNFLWTNPVSGTWNTPANWLPNGIPSNGDAVTFNNTGIVSVTNVPDVLLTSMDVTGTSAVTLTPSGSSGNKSITLANPGTAFNIAAGASLSLNGNGTNIAIIFSGPGNRANIDGTLNCLSGSGVGNYNATNSVTTINGVLRKDLNSFVTSAASNLIINSTGKFQLTGTGSALAVPLATWQTGSTCEIAVTSGGTLTGLGQAFSDFTVNCPALNSAIQCNGALTTVNDTLTITNTNFAAGRSFKLTNTTPYELTVKGNLIISDNACLDITSGKPIPTGTATLDLKNDLLVSGTGLLEQSGSAEATLNFIKPAGIQRITLDNAGSISQTEFSGTLNIGNGTYANKVKLNSNMSLGNYYISNVVVNPGSTLDMGSYILSGLGGNVEVKAGSFLAIGNPDGISSSALSGNIQVTGSRIYSPAANYSYNGTTNQITGNGLPVTINSLTIANTGPAGNNTVELTNSDSTTVLTLSSGLFDPKGLTQTIMLNGSIVATGGNFTTSATGSVTFSNGSISGAINFYPDVNVNGGVNFGTNATINKSLKINNGGYIITNPPLYAGTSILKYNTGGTYLRNVEWSATSGAGYPANIIISNNTNLDLSANGSADRSCAGYLSIDQGSALSMGNMTNMLNVGSNVIIDGTLTLAAGAATSGDIHVGGNWTLDNTGIFISNNRNVYLEGASASQVNGTAPLASFDYLIINKSLGSSVAINKNINTLKGLTFINGIITTDTFKVSVPQNSIVTRISGHVNGNLEKYVPSGIAITPFFEIGDSSNYAPISIRFANVNTAGNLAACTKPGDYPAKASTIFDGNKTINRYWSLVNSGIAFTQFSPTFNFTSNDIDNGVNTDSILCGQLDNLAWTYPAMGAKTATSAKIIGISSFGVFQLGEHCTSPQLSTVITKVSCKTGSNGAITLTENGGSFPFSYVWSNGATTKNVIGLAAGIYTVTVTGQGGCSSVATATVTQPALKVAATAVNNGPLCAGSTLNLTGTASGGTTPLTYSWNGPVGFSSSVLSPSISNSNASTNGTYSLIVTDANGCSVIRNSIVVINTVAPVITGATSFCAGSSTVLNSGLHAVYSWSTGTTSQIISVNTGGTYTVTVTDANSCSGSGSVSTTVIPVLTPAITIAANTGVNICTGSAVTFSASISNGGATPVFQWFRNNIATGTNSATYTDANLNNADVIKCRLSCACAVPALVTSNLITMTVSQPVPVSAGIGPLLICGTGSTQVYGKINNVSSGYSGTWSTTSGTGTLSSTVWDGINGVTYTASVSDSGKTIFLILTGPVSGSCPGKKDSIAVTVNPGVSLIPGAINSICKGTTSFSIPYSSAMGSPTLYSLESSLPNPILNFTPVYNQPLPASSITVTLPNVVQAGTYNFSLRVATSLCTSDIYNLQLKINSNPVINVSAAPASFCAGSSGTLTATGASTYLWLPDNMTGSVINVSPLNTSTYTVTGTNANGCSATNTIAATVNPLPNPIINGASSFCYFTSTVLDALPGYTSYLWSTNASTQTLSVSDGGTYTVTVTDANGCSASVSKSVTINPSIVVTASANRDSIQPADTVLLNSTASGSVSGINYTVSGIAYAPVSGTSTKVTLSDDQMSTALPIGFNFSFYGTVYSSFYISSNGFITFNAGSNDGCCQGPPIPNFGNGNVSNMISLAWNDLSPAGGIIDYFTTGAWPNRKLVVRYNIFHINGDPVTTQAVLCEGTNTVEIHSTTIPNMTLIDPTYISTMGVENNGGTSATAVPGRNGSGWAAINDAWQFVPYASYSYLWSPVTALSNPGIKNPVATPITTTIYTVTVTAYNGCTGTATKKIKVNQPSQLTVFSNATPITCYGGNAIVTVSAVGGIAPYTGTGTYIVNAGTYTYTITDATGYAMLTTITVSQPPALVASSAATSVLCNGGNGAITVSASGGTPPYTGTGNFVVTAGTYTYIVTDSKGCTASTTKTVSQPLLLTSASSSANIPCYGGNTVVSVTASGGTPPYSGTGSFTVTAGTYNYTITDFKGCTSITSIIILQPAPLTASCYAFTTICYGDSSIVTVNGAGGTAPYTGTGNFKVSAGDYTFIITDAKGCTVSTAITITQLPQLTCSVTLLQNVSCYGENNGKLQVNAGNGNTPYIYLWSDGTTGKTLTGLVAGGYTVTVTDNSGCSIVSNYTITEPDDLVINGNFANVSCNGGNNGSVNANVSGGTAPFTYIWNNGSTATTITSLASGTYKVTVTDANGCTSLATYIISQPSALSVSGSSTYVNCFGGNSGTAGVTASGGTPSYNYLWSNGATLSNVNGLIANDYTVTVTDSYGCALTKTYTVTEPALLEISNTQINTSCYGDNDGKATANPSGGSTPYSYLWSNGATNKIANVLLAGAYTVTVTDNRGCTKTASTIITQPPLLTALCSGTAVSCNGISSGSVNVAVAGGTLPYTYLWNNTATATSISGLTAANYTVTITDDNACKTTATFQVTQPTLLSVTGSPTNLNCNGSNTGAILITVSGGTLPYSYLWNTGSTNASISGLAAGTYILTVTDNKGCTTTRTYAITQPTALSNTLTLINVNCNGNSNGSATSNPAGGTTPYSYLWSSSVTTKTASGLSAGTYTVTVTDNKGCTKITSVTLTQPAILVVVNSSTNINCYGINNGTAGVSASGGVAPYSYLWNNGSTLANLSGLSSGTYTVTVTDDNGCAVVKTIIITAPALLVASNTQSNVTCNGSGNGSATANPAGGSTPYIYLWSNGASTKTANNLANGIYTVTVTDNKGCTKTAISVITQPAVLTAVAGNTNISCNGGVNGGVNVSASGGISPYTYLWNNGTSTITQSGLGAGNYTVTVNDANGCTAKVTSTVTQPAALVINGSAVNVSCFGAANGSASGASSGGTSPYTYLWNTSSTLSSLNNLSPGTYSVTVTDSKGCSTIKSYIITEPLLLTLSISPTNSTCNGANNGSATANPTGGNSPYSYLWNNGANAKTISNLSSGTYTITVTDNKGCVISTNTAITEPSPLGFITNLLKPVSCNGGANGKIDLSITGGTSPYTNLWSNGATTKIISSLTVGTYIITVTDNKGCTKIASYTVTEPPVLTLTLTKTNATGGNNNGTATVNATGGTSPYTYAWSTAPVKITATITGLGAGAYTVTVTDFNSCTQTGSISLTAARLANSSSDNGEMSISIMPNPNHGVFRLKVNTGINADATIQLSDATARVIYLEKISLMAGENEKLINVGALAKGIYMIRVNTSDRGEVFQLVIQ